MTVVFGVVYLIWNMVNGKKYVGQTIQPLKKRFQEHAKCKKSAPISRAIRKYGKENFYCGVIKSCASKEELDYWEKFYIAVLKTKVPYGYNRTDGGEGTIGYRHTPECRAKLSAEKTGEKNHFFGKHLSEEHRASIKMALTGKTRSPEHCKNLSLSKLGKPLPSETCIKMSESQSGEKCHNYGKPCAPKISSKISVKNRGSSPFQNLLKEIDAHQLSYNRLAILMGLSYPSISSKMLGRLNFTDKDAAKLQEIFGKPSEYLLKQEICSEIKKAQREDSPYKNLLNELDQRDISYRGLAKLLGVSHASAARKMRGERNFTCKDKAKLVEIFGKPIDYLLQRETGTETEKVTQRRKKRRVHSQKTCSKRAISNRGNSTFKNLLGEIDNHQLTYTSLAELMGLSVYAISLKMLGKCNFTDKDKAKLVEIFDKPIEYLLQREDGKEIEEPVRRKKGLPHSPKDCSKRSITQRSGSSYKNLLKELDAKFLSYSALAKLLISSQATISAKMRGQRNFNDADKTKLVEIFGKPIEYLLERSEG